MWSIIRGILRVNMIVRCFLLMPIWSVAQKDSVFPRLFAPGMEYVSSGNTHGGFIRPFCGLEKGRDLFTAGPLFQISAKRLNGVRIHYSRNISAAPMRSKPDPGGNYRFDRIQFGFSAFIQYIHHAGLSRYVRDQEKKVARGEPVDFDKLKLSTLESGAGIELRINLAHNFSWYNCAMVCMHHHLLYTRGISRERTALTLGLASGIVLAFARS